MSRSGYSDDYGDEDPLLLGRWRGAVLSSIRGKRGQAFLREMVAALDAMPKKRLISHDLVQYAPAFVPPEIAIPCVCAIGSVGLKRGVTMETLDPHEADQIADTFGIAAALVREIEFVNDECGRHSETPEERWFRVRKWAETQLAAPLPAPPEAT
jgi:hypothetical protein